MSHAAKGYRVLGFILDQTFVYLVQLFGSYFGAFVAAVFLSMRSAPEGVVQSGTVTGMFLGWFFWGVAAWTVNFGVLQGLYGGSVGKLLCGIRVVNQENEFIGIGSSLLRSLFYFISAVPFYLGYLSIFFSQKNQCWHDLVVGSFVIRVEDLPKAEVIPIYGPEPLRAEEVV